MLREFMAEWNEALNNRVVRETTFIDPVTRETKRDVTGKVYNDCYITSEISVANFRGTEIQIHRHTTDHNRFYTNLFVPKTNKHISNRFYRTRAQCAAAIMMALTMGTELDERRQARANMRCVEVQNRNRTKLISTLHNGGFDEAAINVFLQFAKEHPVTQRPHTYDTIAGILAKHYADIMGTSDAVKALDEREQRAHIERMYEHACVAQSKAFTIENGDQTLSRSVSAYLFRDVELPVQLPQGIMVVRSILRQLDEECPHIAVFMRIMNILVAIYEQRTGITPVQMLANREIRRASLREKRLQHIQGGRGRYSVLGDMGQQNNKPNNNNNKRTWNQKKNNTSGSNKHFNKKQDGIVTVGDVFGDAFDSLASEDK